MRALVTGSHGFVGKHLVALLETLGYQVWEFDARAGHDVRNYEEVRQALEEFWPDEIYHLAAVAWPGESMLDPRRCFDVNFYGTFNVLEAARCMGLNARVLLTGTSEEYGYEGREHETLTEQAVCLPTTPYGVSKLAATTMGVTYHRRFGLHVVAMRAFNHTGYGRQSVNAESSWARRIAAIERKESTELHHRNLSSFRDFSDVRDVVRAYEQAIKASPGIYNVCSGHPVQMRSVLETLLGCASVPITVVADAPDELEPFPATSYEKLHAATGWVPLYSLDVSLGEVLRYWREQS